MIDPWLSPGHMLQVPAGEMVLVGSPPRLVWAATEHKAAEALRQSMDLALAEAMADVAANREKLVRAFIAETGFKPSECEMVEERHGFSVTRFYVRRREHPHALDEADRP